MNFQIQVIKHKIAATQQLINSGLKQYVLQLIDLETQLEEAMNQAEEKKYYEVITNENLVSYASNGIVHRHAVLIEGEERNRKYRDGINVVGKIDTTGLNGVFELHAVVMRHFETSYLVLKDGDVILHTAHRADVKVFQAGIKLPALQGSPKQIKWAEDLRRKYILVAEPEELAAIANQTSAVFFINWQNNRFTKTTIEVERDGKTFQIPSAPGIYTIQDERIVYGGGFRVAHNGKDVVYFPSPTNKPSHLSQINWRLASATIQNNKVKVGR